MTTLRRGCYAHFKGRQYEVLSVAKHTETEEEMVVYREMYTETPVFVRPLAMFLETVDTVSPRGRFEYIGDAYEYHYKVIGFCPRTDIELGRWGFTIELDFDFAVRCHQHKLTAVEQRGLNSRFRSLALTINSKQYPLFDDYPRVGYLDDSLLISSLCVPGNACTLDIDNQYEIRERDRHKFSKVDYHPHNIDFMSQAVQLLAIFAEWYLMAAATVRSSITPLDEKIEVKRGDDDMPDDGDSDYGLDATE